jgi:(p)ppGpp synthase/HD superfamily hydrolase
MNRYHVNLTTGVPGKCRAIKSCPFGLALEDHYSTPSEARAAFEKQMVSKTFASLKREPALSVELLRTIPANILRDTPLKELSAAQLAQTLQHEAVEVGMDRDVISSAVDLATILHAHQSRGNRGNFVTTPYIEHPLRNAVRLLRLGVTNQDVITAVILHDTVEDGADVFVKKFYNEVSTNDELESRAILSDYISKAYGSNVARLVEAVTNDYIADTEKSKMTLAQKNMGYLIHVRDNIKGDAEVILVKITDFVDNASGLYHNDIPGREVKTKRQAQKYRPVVDVFLEELKTTKLPIPEAHFAALSQRLEKTKISLDAIIARHS